MPDYNSSFDRTFVRLLTKEDAQKTGHIAWIECDNAEDALRAMVAAVEKAPCNCAIWANAAERTPPRLLESIRNMQKYFSKISFPPDSVVLADSDMVRERLNKIFEKSARGDEIYSASPEARAWHTAALEELRSSADKQTATLMNLFHPTHLNIRLQSGPLRTREEAAGHVDGNPYGAKYRILQAFESPTTCLIDNDTFIKMNNRTLTPEEPVTYWQVPANSMVLFTNAGHPHLPILHAEPPWPEDPAKPPPHRTLAVYDLVYKPK